MNLKDLVPNPPCIISISDLVHRLRLGREELYHVGHYATRYYRTRVTITPKPDGPPKERRIDAPQGPLKQIQRRIQRKILRGLQFPTEMHGGIRSRWILTNAKIHLRQPEVLGLDLKDCFPSTGHGRVFWAWRKVLGCSTDVASLLTRLTSFNHSVPQGGRTSSAMVNLCLLPLHADLRDFCLSRGLRFSIYVDDVTVSGLGAIAAKDELVRLISRHHYQVSISKIKGMRAHERQIVTGIVINRKASVPRDRRAAIREHIYLLSRWNNVPVVEWQRVQSEILFVETISKSQGLALRRLASRRLPGLFSRQTKTVPAKSLANESTLSHG